VRTILHSLRIRRLYQLLSNRTLRLGNREDLAAPRTVVHPHLFERLPRLVNSILLIVLALFLLALYFTQKGHIEYLWLALHELVQAPIGFVDLAGSSARIDQLWYAAVFMQLVLISAYLYFEFLIAFLALRRRWYIAAALHRARFCRVGPGCSWWAGSTRQRSGSHRNLSRRYLGPLSLPVDSGLAHLHLPHPDRRHAAPQLRGRPAAHSAGLSLVGIIEPSSPAA
jgi:hypothetical protein